MRFAMAFLLLTASVLLWAASEFSAEPGASPCGSPEAGQFDFWIGEWDLEWGDGHTGTNRIRKALDGCVIVEEFDGTPAIALRGMSVSSHNSRLGQWQQTWVDNQGGYLDFVGGIRGSRMVLEREAVRDGEKIRQRMVWYDIEADSLKWNWERSKDNGESWEVLWKIHYRRAQPADGAR